MTIPLMPEQAIELTALERGRARLAVGIARLIIALPPAGIARTVGLLVRGARQSSHAEAAAARAAACTVSARCAGLGCVQRSVAVVLMCRMKGGAPTWCTGIRTRPFAAHAWVEVDGQPVGEPGDLTSFRRLIVVHRKQEVEG